MRGAERPTGDVDEEDDHIVGDGGTVEKGRRPGHRHPDHAASTGDEGSTHHEVHIAPEHLIRRVSEDEDYGRPEGGGYTTM